MTARNPRRRKPPRAWQRVESLCSRLNPGLLAVATVLFIVVLGSAAVRCAELIVVTDPDIGLEAESVTPVPQYKARSDTSGKSLGSKATCDQGACVRG